MGLFPAILARFTDDILGRAVMNVQGGVYATALQAASNGGDIVVVRLLIEHGADVNAQGLHYGTALQAASARGHNDIVSFLLGHGADVNAQSGISGTRCRPHRGGYTMRSRGCCSSMGQL